MNFSSPPSDTPEHLTHREILFFFLPRRHQISRYRSRINAARILPLYKHPPLVRDIESGSWKNWKSANTVNYAEESQLQRESLVSFNYLRTALYSAQVLPTASPRVIRHPRRGSPFTGESYPIYRDPFNRPMPAIPTIVFYLALLCAPFVPVARGRKAS